MLAISFSGSLTFLGHSMVSTGSILFMMLAMAAVIRRLKLPFKVIVKPFLILSLTINVYLKLIVSL